MELEHIVYEKKSHIATVTLNRPDVSNALNGKMRRELRDVWTDFKDDDDVWVAVLIGAGDQHFCVGMDQTSSEVRQCKTK